MINLVLEVENHPLREAILSILEAVMCKLTVLLCIYELSYL